MAKNKSLGGGCFLIVFLMIFWAITGFSREIFIIGFFVGLIWLLYKIIGDRKIANTSEIESSENPIRITVSTGSFHPDFKALSSNGDKYWVSKGRTARNQEFNIGDMIYVGQGLQSVEGGGPEPALIDTNLEISSAEGDCSIRNLSYWPTYWGASPKARASYLKWLSSGRTDPHADLGYVFLYFYGLERRALHDVKTSEQARAEIPLIKNEIERLLGIYPESGSFQSYAGSLLDFLKMKDDEDKLYEKEPPPLNIRHGLRFEHRLGLSQCSAAGKPLPADWAFVWLTGDPETRIRMPAYRCPEEFRKLFLYNYARLFGEGMILPQNATRLKFQHRIASPTFGYYHSDEYKIEFDLPDVSIISGPLNKLKELAEECCSELDSFSRAIGKDKINLDNCDAIIHLPLILWPEKSQQTFNLLVQIALDAGDLCVMPFNKFRSFFPNWQEVTKQKMLAVYRLLEKAYLGIEPDIRYGGTLPTEDSKVIIFRLADQREQPSSQHAYKAAALTLRLAATVALADSVATDVEKGLLKRQITSWSHLNEVERARLNAALELYFIEPARLTGFKRQINSLNKDAREIIANFLATVAQIDAAIDPKEISVLEKIFRLLGFDQQSVYSKMHVAATEPVTVQFPKGAQGGYKIPPPPSPGPSSGLRLDADKIAILQRDSERVSAILGEFFRQESNELETADEHRDDLAEEIDTGVSMMGLSGEYSSLLQLLLTRTQWARHELEEIASDRKIFLDGALEALNEKSYSLFNMPLFEGDDPLLLNAEVIREVLK